MRRLILLSALLAASSASATQPAGNRVLPAAPPKLLVVISVDQLASDLFDEYRPQLTGGLARVAGGTAFANGYQSHAATATCPGHATILTGVHPARSGIIANSWIDQSIAREDKDVYCSEDETVPGTSSDKYRVSPVHLKTRTLGELMKQKWPASRTVAIAGKDRSAVMMSGQRPDQRWFWEGGAFVTDLPQTGTPTTITRANAALRAAIAQPREALQLPAFCGPKAREVAVEGSGRTVGAGRFARSGNEEEPFRISPEFDGAVLAVSAAMIDELQLGRRAAPDLIAISLSATDLVGHRYGPGGAEMCLQIFSLDRDLGAFFAHLDRRGLDYSVLLTADHGGEEIPERLRLRGIPARRVAESLSINTVGSQVAERLKLSGKVLHGGYHGNIYADAKLSAADRRRVVAEAVKIYGNHPDVEAVFTAEQINRAGLPTGRPDRWSLLERVRASFDPKRSGDLVVLLRQNVSPIRDTKDTVATHGSPWDHDRRVPILFWRKGMPPAVRSEAVGTVDIMPTLAALLGLPVSTAGLDGRCLQGIPGVACPTH